jgi:MarR family transcriptional regulator, organic hydroperoxide resistance regulator
VVASPNSIVALQATLHRVLEHLAVELADLGLTQGEVNALSQLEPAESVTIAALGVATGQRASTLTGVLDRLERRGLVERRLNPRDRRSFIVELTGEGPEVAGRVQAAFAEIDRRALSAVPDHAAEGFFEVLRVLDGLTGN